MSAPSETPLTDTSERLASASLRNAGFFSAGFCRVLDMQDLETALAESRAECEALIHDIQRHIKIANEHLAECERLRNQSNILNTLNLGQIKSIADLQRQLRETETREREAYERAAKVVEGIDPEAYSYHRGLARLCFETALRASGAAIRALADEREGT